MNEFKKPDRAPGSRPKGPGDKAKRKPGGSKFGPKLPPQVFAEAKRLETANGLPFAVAVKVAKGELPLKDALAELLLQEKVKRLVAEKTLMVRYATPVLRGLCPLDKAILLSSVAYRKAEEDYRKCHLDDFVGTQTQVTLGLVDKKTVTGILLEVTKYDLKIQAPGAEEQVFQKHDVKFYFDASAKKAVLKHLDWGSKETRTAPGTLASVKERTDIPIRCFILPQSQGKVVSVHNTEGDVFRGRVKWTGKWEIVLELAAGVAVVLLRHSLVRVDA